jgi:hypothetical protein
VLIASELITDGSGSPGLYVGVEVAHATRS